MSGGPHWKFEELVSVIEIAQTQMFLYGHVSTKAIEEAKIVNHNLGGLNCEIPRIIYSVLGKWRDSDGDRYKAAYKVNLRRKAAAYVGGTNLSHNGKIDLSTNEINFIKKGDRQPRGSNSSSSEANNQLFDLTGIVRVEQTPQTLVEKLLFMYSYPHLSNNLCPFGRSSGKERQDAIMSMAEKYIDGKIHTFSVGQRNMILDIYGICNRRLQSYNYTIYNTKQD